MVERHLPAKLLFVNHTEQVSGAETVLLGLVEHAVSRGHRVVVASPAGPLSARLPVEVVHVTLPPLGLGSGPGPLRPARWAVRSAMAVRRLRRHSRCGTRVVVNSLLALPAAALAAPHRGAVWLVHDVVHRGDQRLVVRAVRAFLRRAVAVSEPTAVPLRALGLAVTVAHNGVRWPVPAISTTLHQPAVIGSLALLTPWKGQQVLLEAVATLPQVVLELAGGHFPGDIEYVRALHERAELPDLAGRVRFLGHVEPRSALQGWDVAVSASIAPEAGPIAVLEAMSMGVPVVGTHHGGTADYLAGGAGLLVRPGDAADLAAALARVLDDADLRARVGGRARARVAARHDARNTVSAMLDAVLK